MKKAISVFAIVLGLSSAAFCAAYSDQDNPLRFRPGLRNSSGNRRLSESQLRLLIESLRAKTGFLELQFDESGFLTLGDRARIEGGSATARKLLMLTVDSQQAFNLEANDHSPEVAFAKISEGIIYHFAPTNARIKVQQLKLDFADFAELRGKSQVRAAFDPGFALLHELGHSILDLRDAIADQRKLGTCDTYINQMRRELGLPERIGYAPQMQMVVSSSGSTRIQAELGFVLMRMESGQARTERFYLIWDAKAVGDMTAAIAQTGAPSKIKATVR